MDEYHVKFLSRSYRDLDGIYSYVAETLLEPAAAEKLLDALDEAILSLEQFPKRGALRKTGAYADKGYRQLFVQKFTIVYRINEKKRHVIIVTVRYSQGQF